MLHTIRRMLEASGGRFQRHSEANYDVLLEHYLVQMLLLYRVSWLCLDMLMSAVLSDAIYCATHRKKQRFCSVNIMH